jgi:hypothetical protein
MPDLVDEVEVELMNEGEELPPPPRRSLSPGKRKHASLQSQLGVGGRPNSTRNRSNSDGSTRQRIPSGSSTASHSSRLKNNVAWANPAPEATAATDTAGPHPWTKDDWKNLERCFIQERKVIAQRLQLASSKDVTPAHVDIDLVLDRFKGFLVLSKQERTGPEWDRYVCSKSSQFFHLLSRSRNVRMLKASTK